MYVLCIDWYKYRALYMQIQIADWAFFLYCFTLNIMFEILQIILISQYQVMYTKHVDC